MNKFLITGCAGTGKTTVLNALQTHEKTCHLLLKDLDLYLPKTLMEVRNSPTLSYGEKVTYMRAHRVEGETQALDALLTLGAHGISGSLQSEASLLRLLDEKFILIELVLSQTVRQERINKRAGEEPARSHEYGKPMSSKPSMHTDKSYVHTIDANTSIEKITDEIIALIA